MHSKKEIKRKNQCKVRICNPQIASLCFKQLSYAEINQILYKYYLSITRNVSETYMPPMVHNLGLVFGIDQVKGSKDIERTTLSLQTDIPTDQPTVAKQYTPFFKGA